MRTIITYIFLFLTVTSCNRSRSSSEMLQLSSRVEKLEPEAKAVMKEWSAYIEFEKNIRIISNTNPLNAIGLMDELANNVSAMQVQIPQRFKTKPILSKIKELDKVVFNFYSQVNRNELREHVAEKHIKSIFNAFDDLNKAINATLDQPKHG